jgi:hypothetical protein
MFLRILSVVAAVLLTILHAPAAKAITYTLTNVPLTDGGSLSGSISFGVYGGISDYSLTTTAGSNLPAETYTYSPTYPPPSATANPFGAPTVLDFYPNANPGTNYVLQLTFSSNVLNGGASLLGGPFSYECILSFNCQFNPLSGLTRYVGATSFGGGNLTSTPLPGALVLFGSVLFGGGLFMRRRRHASNVAG